MLFNFVHSSTTSGDNTVLAYLWIVLLNGTLYNPLYHSKKNAIKQIHGQKSTIETVKQVVK